MKKTHVRLTKTSEKAKSSSKDKSDEKSQSPGAANTTERLTPAERKSAQQDLSASETIARKLKRAAGDEDPAHVAGAIVLFATDTIKRSAENLADARGYLDGMRIAIDGMLKNAFPEKPPEDESDAKS